MLPLPNAVRRHLAEDMRQQKQDSPPTHVLIHTKGFTEHSVDSEVMNVFSFVRMEAILYLLSNADTTRTPRTLLETLRRTNRTFCFIMMFPCTGHKTTAFFFLMGTTWGGSKSHLELEKKRKKREKLWTPSHSTNGMPVELGSRQTA